MHQTKTSYNLYERTFQISLDYYLSIYLAKTRSCKNFGLALGFEATYDRTKKLGSNYVRLCKGGGLRLFDFVHVVCGRAKQGDSAVEDGRKQAQSSAPRTL